MDNKPKNIKVMDIMPSAKRPVLVAEKIEKKEVEKIEIKKAQPEKKPEETKAEKEFLSKWFYKKRKTDIEEEIPAESEEKEEIIKKKAEIKPETKPSKKEDFLTEEIGPEKKRIKFGKYAIIALILVFVAGGAYAALEILPKAEIKIAAKKTAWAFNNSVSASKNFGEISAANKQIPANFFSEKKNATLSYPATGKGHIKKKASGEITIYNAYGSQAQGLVANTRFESSDGKIFRIENKITVPGAKIENGKIIPATIKVKVVADKVGAEYNIGPAKFTIPGFKGTSKYDGFYARSESAMTGGFSGNTVYPTDAEIQSAKEKTEAALRDSSNLLISSQIPSDFKVLEGARQFNITKTEVNQEVTQEGNFSVFMEGELTVVGFKESDLFDLMATLAQKELGEGVRAKEYSLEYGAVRPDIQAGKIDFSINYSGTFWQPVDIEQFKNSILGKKETDLKAFVFSLPGVERATVSLWPFWVKSVPDKVEKVSVIVE